MSFVNHFTSIFKKCNKKFQSGIWGWHQLKSQNYIMNTFSYLLEAAKWSVYTQKCTCNRKQSITCSNIDYWFTCTEDWKLAKKTGMRSQMSQIWLVSSETWYKYCPCLLVIYGGSEISCPLLRCWEWAGARYQKVNRCEIFCDEEELNSYSNSGCFLLLLHEHVATYAHISHTLINFICIHVYRQSELTVTSH